ncbi:unnamed protein product [Mucor circinelloides]
MSSSEWTILEKLLLSQAVYKYGEDNWFQVARNLKHHALLDRPSDYFNQKNCSHQYYSMVSELNKEKKDASTNDMPAVVQLARQLYTLRLEELKRAISQDEEKFLTLVAEIDDIRAGKWDNQLLGLPATSEENSPSKGAESTNTPTANIDSTTEAAPTQPEVMETSSTESSNISDKQPSPLPSGEALEKLAKQEIAAEEAAKVETENIENEARDVRKKDAPPITTEEQQREMANAENNLASSAAAPSDDTAPAVSKEKESTTIPDTKQTSPPPTKPSESDEQNETVSLKRQRDEHESMEESDLKRQKIDNQASSFVDSVPEHTDMEEDDFKSSKKSRIEDYEPLAIDTGRTDYSTDVSRGTTPADLRDGTESIAGSESNAATPTNERSSRRRDDQRNKSWLKNINLLWREIANHKNGAMFMNPIKENIAPHYYEIVKRPMDLKAIKNRIRDGVSV